jgi:protein-tyrosine-phosphatase/uncharacterized protein YndB with AHSA1/START domain
MVPNGMTSQVHAFEAREGGSFRVSLTYDGPTGTGKTTSRTDTYHGRFVTLVPDELVVEVVEFETADPAMKGEMTITITLSDADGGAEVLALHDGLPPGLDPFDNETGWRSSLGKLASLAESLDRVVFACRQSAGRSQMAASFFNALADPLRAIAISAGTTPADRVHPEVEQVMREVGIDLSDARPRLLTAELRTGARLLVTMGCGEECPYIPGAEVQDWALEDPHDKPTDRVREIRDEIRARVGRLVESRGWRLAPVSASRG